jgi:hypothetical protein
MLLIVMLSAPITATRAQSGQLCFNVPGITDCISGIFAEYWQANGGLPVFGYPISPTEQRPTDSGAKTSTQFFERNSFEINPDPNAVRPFHVLLGRLGDSLLQRQGRNWRNEGGTPNPWPGASCKGFQIDGQERSVCGPFLQYWQSHGLELGDRGTSERESLMLFGLPLTAPKEETNPDGAKVVTQWFERARFEYHPNNAPDARVLLGRLGKELQSGTSQPPAADPCAGIAPPSFASIEPNCVKYGDQFYVELNGFQPGEEVGFWITHENGATVGTSQTIYADENGLIGGYIDTTNYFGYLLTPANYVFVAQDARREYEPSIAPFRVIP